jgi:hypothetical protein
VLLPAPDGPTMATFSPAGPRRRRRRARADRAASDRRSARSTKATSPRGGCGSARGFAGAAMSGLTRGFEQPLGGAGCLRDFAPDLTEFAERAGGEDRHRARIGRGGPPLICPVSTSCEPIQSIATTLAKTRKMAMAVSMPARQGRTARGASKARSTSPPKRAVGETLVSEGLQRADRTD